MKLPTLLAPVAALLFILSSALPALAQAAHTGHDPLRKCTWQADTLPVFVPGCTAVDDSGSTARTSIIFGTVVGRTSWKVVVLPGYHFGWVHVWDEGVPLSSSCTKAYARSSVYGIYKVTDCCQPQRFVKPMMTCSFRVRAVQLNDPGTAAASAVTHIHATNTGLSCVTTAAATTNADDAGLPVSVQVPLPGGSSAKITFNLDFDAEEQSIDSASNIVLGRTKASVDEEYAIVTDLDLSATADGAPWDEGESAADLMKHSLFIRTALECKHCGAKLSDQLYLVDDHEKSRIDD